jgi:hypothetical protein
MSPKGNLKAWSPGQHCGKVVEPLKGGAQWGVFRLLGGDLVGDRGIPASSCSLLLPGHEVNGFALSCAPALVFCLDTDPAQRG